VSISYSGRWDVGGRTDLGPRQFANGIVLRRSNAATKVANYRLTDLLTNDLAGNAQGDVFGCP
jgi:hypothetical protein